MIAPIIFSNTESYGFLLVMDPGNCWRKDPWEGWTYYTQPSEKYTYSCKEGERYHKQVLRNNRSSNHRVRVEGNYRC